jgi:two-component system chemotaxis response regulator CheB
MMGRLNVECLVRDVIVIGASAGGVSAIVELLGELPSGLPTIVGVVIHRGATSPDDWSPSLGKSSSLRVVEPSHGELITRGVVYIAPADHHMTFRDNAVFLDRKPKEHHTRPALNPLFKSAALAYGTRVLGIVLTGGGTDGTEGLRDITSAGGLSLVQTPSEAANASMPRYALLHDDVSAALTIAEIGRAIVELAYGRCFPPE